MSSIGPSRVELVTVLGHIVLPNIRLAQFVGLAGRPVGLALLANQGDPWGHGPANQELAAMAPEPEEGVAVVANSVVGWCGEL